MIKKDIFTKLKEANIPYAILVSINKFKNPEVELENNSKDYFIIVAKKDLTPKEKIKLRFKKNTVKGQKVYEKDLSAREIFRFKELQDQFIKIHQNKHGRIYEIKGNSFLDYYDSLDD